VTTMTSPAMIDDQRAQQRLAAKDRSDAVRLARAEIKRGMYDRQLCPVALLRDPPDAIKGMRVFEFLEAVPHVGRRRVRDLNVAAVWASLNLMKTVGELTERQTEWLICNALPAKARPESIRPRWARS
jgi:hypothetical protein